MDVLRRSLAPVVDAAWNEIDEEAARVLRAALMARRVVDVDGPHGLDLGAVSLGRLELSGDESVAGVHTGLHRVLPLVEARAEFELDAWELDNLSRGAEDIELGPLQEAAGKLARFEETTVYEGLESAGIVGLAEASVHDVVTLTTTDTGAWMAALADARLALQRHHVEGPYNLVLGPHAHQTLVAAPSDGYPLTRRVADLLGGEILAAEHARGGFLLSARGGDATLTLGQDVSIGYHDRQGTTLKMFISESFTFRVLAPEAVIRIELAA